MSKVKEYIKFYVPRLLFAFVSTWGIWQSIVVKMPKDEGSKGGVGKTEVMNLTTESVAHPIPFIEEDNLIKASRPLIEKKIDEPVEPLPLKPEVRKLRESACQ